MARKKASLRRHELWRLGAAAFVRSFPTEPHLYICPCCRVGFPEDAVDDERGLTLEHVPPEAMGGRGMLLSCQRCNNNAGSKFEKHSVDHYRFDNLMEVSIPKGVPSILELGDVTFRAAVANSEHGLTFTMDVTEENEHVLDALASWAETQTEVPITIVGDYEEWRMKAGYLRAGYLAVSAWLGYRYILTNAMEPVRAQLASLDADVLPPAAVLDHPFQDQERPAFFMWEEPSFYLGALMVTIGSRAVFFPPPGAPANWYWLFEESMTSYDGSRGYSVRGREVGWPTSDPPYLADSI